MASMRRKDQKPGSPQQDAGAASSTPPDAALRKQLEEIMEAIRVVAR